MGSEKVTLPNMGMDLPINGTTTAPYTLQYIISSLQKVDAHDHSSGKGARLSQSSIQVTANWVMSGYGFSNTKFVGFSNPTTLTDAPNASAYFKNGDFYLRLGGGTELQITKDNSLNTSLIGGFTGDYASSQAFCVFDEVANTYSFNAALADANTLSTVIAGAVEIRSTTQGSNNFGIIHTTSGSMTASYTIVEPDALPSVASFKVVSDAGVESYLAETAVVKVTGNQSIAGVKTFTSFPVTPSSAPSLDYEVSNKKFVDDSIDTAFVVPTPGSEWVWNGTSWVLNTGGSFPEAPSDGKQYARKDAAWDEIVIDVTEAPNDGKQYVRKNEAWAELVTTGGLTPLTASGTLAVNTIYSVDANGDFTFVVPSGSANGDTISIKRSGFGGSNVFTGTFRNGETAIIAKSWNYTLDLTWSATRNLWIYE